MTLIFFLREILKELINQYLMTRSRNKLQMKFFQSNDKYQNPFAQIKKSPFSYQTDNQSNFPKINYFQENSNTQSSIKTFNFDKKQSHTNHNNKPSQVTAKKTNKVSEFIQNAQLVVKDEQQEQTKKRNQISKQYTLEDFKLFQETIKINRDLIEKEINQLHKNNQKKHRLSIKRGAKENWKRVKFQVFNLIRMKKAVADIKSYGTSVVGMQFDAANILEVLKQQQIQRNLTSFQQQQYYVINPESMIFKIWLIFMFVIFNYIAFVIPIIISFDDGSPNFIQLYYMNKAVELILFFDLLVNFNTTFQNEQGVEIQDRHLIAIQNFKSNFVIDFLSIIPFQLFDIDSNRFIESRNINGIFQLLKLPSLVRRGQYFEKIGDIFKVSRGTARLMSFFYKVLITVNIFGCIWYLEAKVQHYESGTWIYELGFSQSGKPYNYLASIYWAFATIATVGFGDIHPFNTYERLICILWMILGVGFFSYTIGSLSTLLSDDDSRQTRLAYQIYIMDEFCKEGRLNQKLQEEIRQALNYSNRKSILSNQEREMFFDSIPYHLQYDLAAAMYNITVQNFPFFQNKDCGFLVEMLPILQPVQVKRGEYVYQQGAYPYLMYFLVTGRVNFVVGTQELNFQTFVGGSYFGQIEIFNECLRLYSVRAEENSELLVLQREQFLRLLNKFELIGEEIRYISSEREIQFNDALMRVSKFLNISPNSGFWRKNNIIEFQDHMRQRKQSFMSASDYAENLQKQILEISKHESQSSSSQSSSFSKSPKSASVTSSLSKQSPAQNSSISSIFNNKQVMCSENQTNEEKSTNDNKNERGTDQNIEEQKSDKIDSSPKYTSTQTLSTPNIRKKSISRKKSIAQNQIDSKTKKPKLRKETLITLDEELKNSQLKKNYQQRSILNVSNVSEKGQQSEELNKPVPKSDQQSKTIQIDQNSKQEEPDQSGQNSTVKYKDQSNVNFPSLNLTTDNNSTVQQYQKDIKPVNLTQKPILFTLQVKNENNQVVMNDTFAIDRQNEDKKEIPKNLSYEFGKKTRQTSEEMIQQSYLIKPIDQQRNSFNVEPNQLQTFLTANVNLNTTDRKSDILMNRRISQKRSSYINTNPDNPFDQQRRQSKTSTSIFLPSNTNIDKHQENLNNSNEFEQDLKLNGTSQRKSVKNTNTKSLFQEIQNNIKMDNNQSNHQPLLQSQDEFEERTKSQSIEKQLASRRKSKGSKKEISLESNSSSITSQNQKSKISPSNVQTLDEVVQSEENMRSSFQQRSNGTQKQLQTFVQNKILKNDSQHNFLVQKRFQDEDVNLLEILDFNDQQSNSIDILNFNQEQKGFEPDSKLKRIQQSLKRINSDKEELRSSVSLNMTGQFLDIPAQELKDTPINLERQINQNQKQNIFNISDSLESQNGQEFQERHLSSTYSLKPIKVGDLNKQIENLNERIEKFSNQFSTLIDLLQSQNQL